MKVYAKTFCRIRERIFFFIPISVSFSFFLFFLFVEVSSKIFLLRSALLCSSGMRTRREKVHEEPFTF